MAVQRLTKESAALTDFSTDDLVPAHASRHTFGTRAVAREMPTDVVQAILGRVVVDDFNLRAGGASAHVGGCGALLRGR
jgi:integrase